MYSEWYSTVGAKDARIRVAVPPDSTRGMGKTRVWWRQTLDLTGKLALVEKEGYVDIECSF